MTRTRSGAWARVWASGPRHGLTAASRRRNPQHITDTADGVNQAWLTLVDLAPQVTDAGLHHVAVADGVAAPDMIEYLPLAEDAAGVQHQEPQHPELGGRQRDQGAVPPDFMAVIVEFQVGDPQPRGPGRPAGAPQHRPDAFQHLVQAERLCDVVVSAEGQAGAALPDTLPSGPEED